MSFTIYVKQIFAVCKADTDEVERDIMKHLFITAGK